MRVPSLSLPIVVAALACGAPKSSTAPPVASSVATVATVAPPASASTTSPSTTAVATAAPTASASSTAPPAPEPITCKTEDDCWVAEDRTPMRRPKALRGKRPKPCHGAEHTPKCEAGVCAVTTWKC